MLKAAQLYEHELEIVNMKSWYDPRYIYYHGGTGEYKFNLQDNNKKNHCFVSVDSDDNILGYISYYVDWEAMSAEEWGIISYDIGNILFARDVYQAILDCFQVYHMNRVSWYCFADNPAIRGYRNFIKRHGGIECGYLRRNTKLRDGKLHDSVLFEILAEEFIH